ncbi:MAG: hypothetical protein K8H88_24805, partial [Sandaracinaceae bacterium]|nr:hypothetical protein [Sandaracinaceae bacterium]
PSSLWEDESFLGEVLALIADPGLPAAGREPLLALALARSGLQRSKVRSIVRSLASVQGPLQHAAIAALLALDPDEAMPHVASAAASLDVLARMLEPLTGRYLVLQELKPHERLERARTETLLALAKLLFEHVGYEDPRPVGVVFSPGPVHELYDLRVALVPTLAQRMDFDPEDLIAHARAPYRERLRAWIGRVRAERSAQAVLARLEADARRPSRADVLDALEGARSVPLRSVEDLRYVLREGLRRLGPTAYDYVELLRGTSSKGGAVREDWPHERSLQAFVLLLARQALEVAGTAELTILHREVQEAAGDDRLDFAGVSVSREGGEAIDLPIEVKWSHSKDWLKGLTEQLGERYVLQKPPRSRGLYVVGFTGGGRTADQRDLARARSRLEEAAVDFTRAHPHVELDVVILRCVR